jgi:hypothetical protein
MKQCRKVLAVIDCFRIVFLISEGNHERKIAVSVAGLAILTTIRLGFFSLTLEGRGEPQRLPPQTTDEKVNQIINRLDKIDKRLSEISLSVYFLSSGRCQ